MNFSDGSLASDEAAQLVRQIVTWSRICRQGWEMGREFLMHHLPDALGALQVLQQMLTQIPQLDLCRKRFPYKVGSNGRNEHLATVRGSAQPGTVVHGGT